MPANLQELAPAPEQNVRNAAVLAKEFRESQPVDSARVFQLAPHLDKATRQPDGRLDLIPGDKTYMLIQAGTSQAEAGRAVVVLASATADSSGNGQVDLEYAYADFDQTVGEMPIDVVLNRFLTDPAINYGVAKDVDWSNFGSRPFLSENPPHLGRLESAGEGDIDRRGLIAKTVTAIDRGRTGSFSTEVQLGLTDRTQNEVLGSPADDKVIDIRIASKP